MIVYTWLDVGNGGSPRLTAPRTALTLRELAALRDVPGQGRLFFRRAASNGRRRMFAILSEGNLLTSETSTTENNNPETGAAEAGTSAETAASSESTAGTDTAIAEMAAAEAPNPCKRELTIEIPADVVNGERDKSSPATPRSRASPDSAKVRSRPASSASGLPRNPERYGRSARATLLPRRN